MSALAIETKDLSFAFHRHRPVLKNLSLQVPEGSIYGFLGPNGAGKTTTIRLLAGMLLSGKDNIFIQGRSLQKDIPQIFESVGWLIETPSLYLHLNGYENLQVIARLRDLPASRIDQVLTIVGLEKAAKRKVKEYSLGMKQRLAIAMALLPDPQLLILDEPVNGLDPNGIVEVREMLIRINREEGKTICVSSHLLAEIEKTCTHIGIINHGELKYQGSLEQMQKDALQSGEVIFRIAAAQDWIGQIRTVYPHASLQGREDILFSFNSEDVVSAINQKLVQMGVPVNGIQVKGGLEEWFMHIIHNENGIV